MRAGFLIDLAASYFRRVAHAPQKPNPAEWGDDRLTAAWLGHATVLINFFGLNILTDPVLGARCGIRIGPLTIGPKRYVAPALKLSELPRIDLILLSHAHMDHFDLWTLRRLSREAIVVTARSTADLLRGIPFGKIEELNWNETIEIETGHGQISIEAFKTNHWGARIGRDNFRGYNGYIMTRNGRRICIAGDTASTDFSPVSTRGPLDLIAVPIAAYNPWIWVHCTPEEAIAMANQAGAQFILPMHHQTFKLSWEPLGEPIVRFKKALEKEPHRIALTTIGETFTLR